MKRYTSTPYRLRATVVGMVGVLLSGWLLLPSARAAVIYKTDSSAEITIPVTLTNTQPTCDLTFTGLEGDGGYYSYFLGSLSPGQRKEHKSFNAEINCQNVQGNEGVSTVLTASVKQGTVMTNHIRMLVDGETNTAGPELWLEEEGQAVPLDEEAFCKGGGLNRKVCVLTPFTRVPDGAPSGHVSALLVFNMLYE